MPDGALPRWCHCPTCGQPTSAMPFAELKGAVGPLMGRVLDAVARRPGISRRDLAHAVYSQDEDGGPDDAEESIAQVVLLGNRRLAALGWVVRARPHHGYYLRRVDPATAPMMRPLRDTGHRGGVKRAA